MLQKNIVVRGAREHNLRNIDVVIPRNKLVVITGVSGSGKSTLAFDTVYAEGQRRYVESLSAYARQFLGRMDKPDVDYIEGLSPAISIDQKGTSRNPRSTVGTVTEIYDYLRLLFARAGRPHCHVCGKPVQKQTVQQIVDSVLRMPKGSRIQIMAPMVRRRKGEHKEAFEEARKAGFVRVRVDGEVRDLGEAFELDKRKWHTIEVVIDRLVIGKSADPGRLSESVESGLKLGEGVVLVDGGSEGEVLFSEKFSCANCNVSLGELEPRTFSFNSPHGACGVCSGLGYRLEVDPELVVPNKDLALAEGAIQPWSRSSARSTVFASQLEALGKAYGFSTTAPFRMLNEKQAQLVLYGTGDEPIKIRHNTRKGKISQWNTPFEGVVNNLQRRHRDTESSWMRAEIERYMASKPCQACGGQRLKPEALSVKVGNLSIMDVANKSIDQALKWIFSLGSRQNSVDESKPGHKSNEGQNAAPLLSMLSSREVAISAPILKEINARLQFLVDIGLGYLTLHRTASTLSGGESQRIRLATQIGSGLMGVLYVCDEPSVGLHPMDDARLIETLQRLRDIGNTVIIVEHDEAIMRAADHIIDLGPGAGEHGGNVVFTGPVEQIVIDEASITGQYLGNRRSIPVPASRRTGSGKHITIKGAREHNLKDIEVEIPLGQLVVITGVSGSGKSTLIYEVLYKQLAKHFYGAKDKPGECRSITGSEYIDKVVNIDQSPIGRTPRSNPATYTGTFSPIRELFSATPEARMRGYKPGRFSFNVKGGRCEACAGDGHIRIEMQFLPDVMVPCEVCNGRRYNREALEITFKGKSVADVLDMTVSEAIEFFANIPRVKGKLQTMSDVGLGYIRLGQPATQLSGGEAQRIKLASELSKRATGKTLYILDEPTTGLSFHDCAQLLKVLHRIVDSGNSVILIEHHIDLVNNGDWVIDLGPGAGESGGRLIAQGTPEKVAGMKRSFTGQYLKEHLRRRTLLQGTPGGG